VVTVAVPTEGAVTEEEETAVTVVLTEEAIVVAVSIEAAAVVVVVLIEEVLTEVQGRCIKRFVQNVKKNAKFLSNQEETNQYIVKNVFRNVNINSIVLETKLFFYYLIF